MWAKPLKAPVNASGAINRPIDSSHKSRQIVNRPGALQVARNISFKERWYLY